MINLIKKYCPGGMITIVIAILLRTVTSVLYTVNATLSAQIIGNLGKGVVLKDCITLFLVILGCVVGVLLTRILTAYTREGMTKNMQKAALSKSLRLKTSVLQDISIGDLNTTEAGIQDMVTHMVWLPMQVIATLASLVTTIWIIIHTDWMLSAVLGAFMTPFVIGFLIVSKKLNKLAVDKRKYEGEVFEKFQRIRCYTVIKSFVKEALEEKSFGVSQDKFMKASLGKKNTITVLSIIAEILYDSADIVIIVFAITQGSSAATALTFLRLTDRLFSPFMNLPDILDDISSCKSKVIKYTDLMKLEEEVDGKIELTEFNEEIRFNNVGFRYGETGMTLQDVNLVIKKGHHVGIYGPSGGGKSTFVNLLPRFFKVTTGRISIDGVDINSLTSASLRSKIGIVSQNIYLFSNNTIRENIMYGNPHATEAEMVEAAKMANAHEFISKLPNGYDSIVGNEGVRLSGGEQQRVSIARMLLANPDIIILDEATSKLDNESEAIVQDAIDKACQGKTVISIAHRLSTIRDCDYLVGIDNHTIYEIGKPEDLLMNKDSLFYRLSNM